MRASVLRAVGPRPESLPHTSDLALWLQMAVLADVGRINGPAQGFYRVHADSMQRTIHTGHLFDLQARRDAFDVHVRLGPRRRRGHAAPRRRTAGHRPAHPGRARPSTGPAGPTSGAAPSEVEVDELLRFALEVWPAAEELPQWRALARRRAVGADRAPRVPAFVARALVRRGTESLGEWRWQRTGVR